MSRFKVFSKQTGEQIGEVEAPNFKSALYNAMQKFGRQIRVKKIWEN
jgi:1,2-phenylacetyl-CoA epoxidase PaaB subunit